MLKVNEIFSSFQGEGPYMGTPATFIRLSGCNLNCNYCDTDFNNYTEIKVDKIKINNPLLVITGGEPLLQYDELKKLIKKINSTTIQIETNGTIHKPLLDATYIISPKKNIQDTFLYYKDYDTTYFKFIIENLSDLKEIEELLKANSYTELVWLQPEYGRADEITSIILDYNPEIDWKLSLQTHKYVGAL